MRSFNQIESETDMFAIKFISSSPTGPETTYHVYSYTVMHHVISDAKTICMALDLSTSPYPHDNRAVNMDVENVAFVMNETGKTIDTIRGYSSDCTVPG